MASAVFKQCISRMSNMLVEAFFTTLKNNDIFRLRSMRLDMILYIINIKANQLVLESYQQKITQIDYM